jgi:CO/xanthine dehydrogenase FAD-binding subunit
VGAAVRIEGDLVAEARIVLGAVSSSPVRAERAEQVLVGRALDPAAIAEASEAAAGPSRPMDNADFSFLWRKEMTKKWVAAALSTLAPGAAGAALKVS